MYDISILFPWGESMCLFLLAVASQSVVIHELGDRVYLFFFSSSHKCTKTKTSSALSATPVTVLKSWCVLFAHQSLLVSAFILSGNISTSACFSLSCRACFAVSWCGLLSNAWTEQLRNYTLGIGLQFCVWHPLCWHTGESRMVAGIPWCNRLAIGHLPMWLQSTGRSAGSWVTPGSLKA